VKRGYVDFSEHWRYSSYRNYFDQAGAWERDKQHFLCFFPLPHGHFSFLPIFLPRSQAPAWECILLGNAKLWQEGCHPEIISTVGMMR
jgi:hypothetical protein